MTLQDEYHNQWNPKASAGDLEYFIDKFDCRVEDSREYNQYTRQAPSYHRDFYDSDNYKM